MEIFILGLVLIVAMWTVDGCNKCDKKSRKKYKNLLTTH